MKILLSVLVFTTGALAQQPRSLPLPFAGDDYRISAALGDVDGDGVADLVVGRNGRFDLLRGLPGAGRRFAEAPRALGHEVGPSCESAGAPQLVDCDGDGDLDLLTIDAPLGSRQRVVWFANTGDGTFGPARTVVDRSGAPLAWNFELCAAWRCDWDADGHADLLVATPRLLVHRGDAAGFAAAPDELGVASRSFAVLDWDRDGDLDLVTAEEGMLRLHLRTADGLAEPVAVTEVGDRPVPVRLTTCDWDGNGAADLLIGEHREMAPVAVPPAVAAEQARQLAAAERVLAALQEEYEALARTPPSRRDPEAMARRRQWREELDRWGEGPRSLAERLREARRNAGRPTFPRALRVWVR